jgi:hypothetical protein
MRTIETAAEVGPDGKLVVQIPPDVPPGPHRVVVVVEEQPAERPKREPLTFSKHDLTLIDPSFTFRREDLYGDDGR